MPVENLQQKKKKKKTSTGCCIHHSYNPNFLIYFGCMILTIIQSSYSRSITNNYPSAKRIVSSFSAEKQKNRGGGEIY